MRAELKSDRGISLIEMVVAVLILSIGVIAGFRGLGQAQRGIGDEVPRLIAQQVVMNRAEAMQMLGAGQGGSLPDRVLMGGINWDITTETKPTQGGFVEARILAKADGYPGAQIVVYAPASPPR